MCGIAGFIKRRQYIREDEKKDIDRMLSRISHRGPDDSGACGICDSGFENSDKAVNIRNRVRGVLGFNRLSIQDLTAAGHQPMLSEDGNAVITFNGEIYNVEELKEMLRKDGCSMSFRGHSDTEVILKCYCMYGIDKTLKILNGMFALVIADKTQRTIYIARDRIGIIPCHIMIDENRIVWASEIKAFLALPGFSREISEDALSDALKYSYPNTSMYKDVENVEPGTYLAYQWEENTIRKERYYSLPDHSGRKRRIDTEECEAVLKDCLSRQLIGDAPLGVQLSGGVDSTLLAKYASDIYRDQGNTLCGFSLVNRAFEQFSEEKWIDYAANRLPIDLHKYDFSAEAFAMYYEKALYAFERFISIPSPAGIYLFSAEAKKNVTVLISGEGADELAGGYNTFSLARRYGMLEKLAGQKVAERYGKHYPQTRNPQFTDHFDAMLQDAQCRQIYPAFTIEKSVQTRRDYIDSLTGISFEKMRLLYFKEELVSLLERQNKVCMANSVDNRVPFLDNRMIDLLFSTDEDQLVHPMFLQHYITRKAAGIFEGKYILKQISAAIYGKEFAFRKKQALRAPLDSYILDPHFQAYLNEYILPGMRKRGIVDMKVFDSAYSGLSDHTNFLMVWKAINLETWMQLFYDGRSVVDM